MQYPIPQFIEEEGKIIFFLTYKQFFLITISGAICIGFYFFLPFWLFFAGSAFVAIACVSIGFIKIDNEPIIKIVYNFFTFSTTSKNYVWKRDEYQERVVQKPKKIEKAAPKAAPHPAIKTTTVSKLNEAKKRIETQH